MRYTVTSTRARYSPVASELTSPATTPGRARDIAKFCSNEPQPPCVVSRL